MHRRRRQTRLTCIVLVFLALISAVGQETQEANQPNATRNISEFGKYQGYSEQKYKKWVLQSRYIEMRDGVKLAIDVVRPSADGMTPVDDKVPVIWTHSRYHRNFQAMNPATKSMVDAQPDLQRLVKHGYAVASVGVRGSGASFGRFEGLFSPAETRDAYEIIDWLSKQPWCTGKVGMYGGSYLGMTQYMAASQNHPALKAIFPVVAGFDLYEVLYPGGVFREDMIAHWDQLTEQLDNNMVAANVQTDSDGKMLRAAIKQHADNWEVLREYRKAEFRDTVSDNHSWKTHNPSAQLEAINIAQVPSYHWNGFLDVFATDTVLWYANFAGPQKMSMGPWPHSTTYDRRYLAERLRLRAIEQHRWFDYWLKGIDNRIMDEPPINYASLDEPKSWVWKSAHRWPPKSVTNREFYFSSGPSDSIDSVNDGILQTVKPAKSGSADEYRIDLTTTTGSQSRWDNAVGQGAMKYGDMTANDRKCLTYTTTQLEEDLTITGSPVATLYVNSSVEDCDFHVLLEEVDDENASHYVTEGVLRASQRAESKAPWNNLGLPYQRCFKQDQKPLTKGEVTKVRMDLLVTSVTFNKGHRIRVSIMFADADNTTPIKSTSKASIHVHHSSLYPSGISLPMERQE